MPLNYTIYRTLLNAYKNIKLRIIQYERWLVYKYHILICGYARSVVDNILFSDISQKRIYNLHDSLNDIIKIILFTQNLFISNKNLTTKICRYSFIIIQNSVNIFETHYKYTCIYAV